MKHRFYQDTDGRWYIDLPQFITEGHGTKANLEMVAGADKLLSHLAAGNSEVTLQFDKEPFDHHQIHLVRSSNYGYSELLDPEDDPGGWYDVKGTNQTVWLCPVTLYVFQEQYPENIYIKPIN